MSNIGLHMSPDSKVPRGPRHRARSWMAVLLSLSVFAVGAGVVYWALNLTDLSSIGSGPDDFAGEGSGEVIVTVTKGQTIAQIGQTLKKEGVVASVDAWLGAAKLEPMTSSIGPGSYSMLEQMSAESAVARMISPKSRVSSKLLLREGLRIWESMAKIAKETDVSQVKLEKAAASGKIGLPKYADNFAEGFLFPATYEIDKGESATAILSKTVKQYNDTTDSINFAAGAKKQGVSTYEALIIASLIQAEGHPNDFAKISRVIYNRLDPKTWGGTYGLLQMDATVNYALRSSEINLTTEQLKGTESKYNTYKHAGLPPTPINSPGEAAMKAAINPAKGDWLYYVTVDTKTGETKFTADYQEFLKFKAELSANNKKN
ncbi:MAG: endolytic transglycosylase MltG [Candidatus Nanopelagicales bacterium]